MSEQQSKFNLASKPLGVLAVHFRFQSWPQLEVGEEEHLSFGHTTFTSIF